MIIYCPVIFLHLINFIALKDNDIKTRDQLADLSSFELMEFLNDIDNKKVKEVILESRKHWFEK